jgi:hypothetical protein
MYAQCGSNGWSNSWEADMHLILQWAGYQPRIIYDETVRKNGLDAYDILVMPNCYVLTQSVYDEIVKFQKRGGIVVSDDCKKIYVSEPTGYVLRMIDLS